jgi:hypothetical protein
VIQQQQQQWQQWWQQQLHKALDDKVSFSYLEYDCSSTSSSSSGHSSSGT